MDDLQKKKKKKVSFMITLLTIYLELLHDVSDHMIVSEVRRSLNSDIISTGLMY